jgi:hypothetical protein
VLGQTETDASGAFRLTIDASTSVTTRCMFLSAEKAGYVKTDIPQLGTPPITIRMQRLRRVAGRVMEVDGGPLQRVTVSGGGQSGRDRRERLLHSQRRRPLVLPRKDRFCDETDSSA